MSRLICRIFGHRWHHDMPDFCERCCEMEIYRDGEFYYTWSEYEARS